jgi:hypothetical protein
LGKLHKPLGEWYENELHKHNHNYLLHHTKQHIAVKNTQTNKWKLHNLSRTNITKMEFTRREHEYLATIDLTQYIPVDIQKETTGYTMRTRRFNETLINTNNSQTGDEKWIQELLQCTTEDEQNDIMKNTDKQWYIGTDGGVRNNIGSYGLTIASATKVIIQGGFKVPEIFNKMISYRTEGIGILQSLKVLLFIRKTRESQQNWHQPNIILVSNSKSMIDYLNQHRYYTLNLKDYHCNETDIIVEILSHIKQLAALQCYIQLKHVKGHQDQHIEYSKLTWEAKLNIIADKEATLALSKRTTQEIKMKTNIATIFIKNKQLTNKFTPTIREEYHMIGMKNI